MLRHYMALILLGALALGLTTHAQQLPGPELAKLSNLAFGWVSMSGVDPTLDMLTSFAPTTMALRDAGYRTGGEMVTGVFSFGDLDVNSDFASAMTAVGPGVLRLCQYEYSTNLANIAGMAGMPACTDGKAIEVSYAQRVGSRTNVGVSIVPEDSSSVTMKMGGQNMVTSETETDYGVRAGAVYMLPRKAKLGVDYSYQHDYGVTKVNPLLTGAPEWLETRGDFITRCATIGASKKISGKTTAYAAFQNILATGDSLGNRSADLVWMGVQHSVSKKLDVRANYIDGGQNYSLMWRSPVGIVNLAYTHNALKNAEDILGDGDSAFASLAVGF